MELCDRIEVEIRCSLLNRHAGSVTGVISTRAHSQILLWNVNLSFEKLNKMKKKKTVHFLFKKTKKHRVFCTPCFFNNPSR